MSNSITEDTTTVEEDVPSSPANSTFDCLLTVMVLHSWTVPVFPHCCSPPADSAVDPLSAGGSGTPLRKPVSWGTHAGRLSAAFVVFALASCTITAILNIEATGIVWMCVPFMLMSTVLLGCASSIAFDTIRSSTWC